MRSSAPTLRRAEASAPASAPGAGLRAWLARFAGRSGRKGGRVAYPAIDAKTALYVVGDIHGRADLLRRVHEAIETDWAAGRAERRLEIYLGDYVDRGPDSAGVIAMLRARMERGAVMALSGNHEAVLLQFLEGQITDRAWLEWGGAATALSYGVNASREAVLSAALARAVPLEDIRFLKALRPCFRYGPYFFAHAGVLPNRALEEQLPEDLLWIRGPFLDHTGPFGAIVVHGHTPHAEPEFLPNRINLDTGAYATHRLSCLRIDATGASLIGD
jgi:serine/threonine protein phosphatase 1